MENQTISAAVNPELANEIAASITEPVVGAAPLDKVVPPPSGDVKLIAGMLDPFTGELELRAKVRELNGSDEEAISRISDSGKALLLLLDRAVVQLGDNPATQEDLDLLLAGDREQLLLEIRKVTFGNTITFAGPCPSCDVTTKIDVDLDQDVKIKKLEDPKVRRFTVKLKKGTAVIELPTGLTQKKLLNAGDKSPAELDTLLLKDCLVEINGQPVMDLKQINSLGLQDRRTLLKEIGEKNFGPQLSDVVKACASCGSEVPLPLTLAELF